ncbi:PilC/PilY family type IV pilus protein [Massilia sp. W12]|uniref:pilus assembly protein n=1 Tax=Massilia sp. W12 TaxID=3126507 RepID=UPI0030CF27DC
MKISRPSHRRLPIWAWLLLPLATPQLAQAALADISNAPLVTSATSSVLPNIMFILDDSGSMDWDYMPDHVNDSYCKTTGGAYNAACCGDSASSGGSGSSACWHKSTSTAAPFGTWRAHPPFLAATFNGVAYNPAITYTPPIKADGSSWPNITSWTAVKNDAYNVQNTQSTNLLTQFPDLEWCTDTSYTDCLRNDNYILPGTVNGKSYRTFHATTGSGTGFVATGSPAASTVSARTFGPHFYTILPGEYCDSPQLRNCQATQGGAFVHPAYVRWCSTSAATTAASANPTATATLCQATRTGTYQYVRYPTKFFTPGTAGSPEVPGQPYIAPVAAVKATVNITFTLSGTCNGSNKVTVTQVKVNGSNVMTSSSSASTSSSSLADSVRSKIGSGYTATVAGNVLTIYGTLAQGNITFPVSISHSKTGSLCNLATSPASPAFSGGVTAVTGQPYIPYQPAVPATPTQYYGSFVRTDIVPAVNSYPFPGTAAKAATRTDCAGATCTYNEEMTNFANWWTYYHTRMQMMKSSTSIAFNPIDSRYRVGYLTINNSSGSSDFINLNTFNSSQRSSWYAKMVAARPSGSTPLRKALTNAGRLYAGALNGGSLNGVTVVDPMQYSCQQNFTILSTDGYWNESDPGGYQIDGVTAIGDQDGDLQRPQLDGDRTANTLSDVAAYYYKTDLRTSNCTGSPVPPASSGNDVCANNVPISGLDAAAHQHMTTFTVGLGANGQMQYTAGYASATSGDYFNIKNGNSASPAAGICTWQTGGICNWPKPTNNGQTTIDDLWHAAVNGYGTYFSASNPSLLTSGISSALAGVSARTGSSSAATTSNPNISTGDNFLFSSTFTSVNWDGEMVRNQIDINTGQPSSAADWSAQSLLDANTSRTIYTYAPGQTNNLKIFNWSNLSATEKTYFTTPAISGLSQFCASGSTCLSAGDQTSAAGNALVEYLRGDRSNEGPATDVSKFFRARNHVLGDIVNSEAVYTKTPQFNYNDSGYSSFKSSASTRQGMVYVGANDGMLHAFNAETGVEAWAYVPNLVMANMYKLADKNYATQHIYTVDGTIVQADVYAAGSWRTIIIGGLNAGGRGYYALDVTDPLNPKALWEFTSDTGKGGGYSSDANLGYSFGKATVGKLKDGTWVALISSGYNNVSPGDGKGYVYVLDAYTGSIKSKISTNTGSSGTPSGLGQIATWVEDSDLDNTIVRAYSGDLLGNVWRIDIDDNVEPAGNEAQKLATVSGPTGVTQPITAKPEIALVGNYPVVYVGTGRYLGASDLADTNVQSVYAIKDLLTASADWGNPRSGSKFVQQTITSGTCPSGVPSSICSLGQSVRNATSNPVDFTTMAGWYLDLPDRGERINTDPQLISGTLVLTTNVPNASACTIGGYSYVYFLDYKTGGPVNSSTGGVVGKNLGNTIATRPVVAKLPNNTIIAIIQMSDGTRTVAAPPIQSPSGKVKRVTWRELIDHR